LQRPHQEIELPESRSLYADSEATPQHALVGIRVIRSKAVLLHQRIVLHERGQFVVPVVENICSIGKSQVGIVQELVVAEVLASEVPNEGAAGAKALEGRILDEDLAPVGV
jgi:hypothetical protein